MRNLWEISKLETPESRAPLFKKKEYAEFILPSKVNEVLSERPDANLDDVLQ